MIVDTTQRAKPHVTPPIIIYDPLAMGDIALDYAAPRHAAVGNTEQAASSNCHVVIKILIYE